MTGFQTSVNNDLPLPTPGSFASANPRHSVVGGEQQYTAIAAGVTVGNFAWVNGNNVQSYSTGVAPDGIVSNELQAVITTWLAETTYTIPGGLPVTLYSGGDFWVKMTGSATRGNKVFVDLSTGAVSAAAAGTAATVGGTSTTSSITGTVLTVAGTVAGTAYKVGQIITGGTTAAGTVITSLGTGTGGAGTYNVNISQTVTSAALNSQTNIETTFYVNDTVTTGQMVKITSKWSK